MPNLNVNILGRDGNTRAKVTGQEELLVKVGSIGALGLATEATLLNVLTAVDNMRDYEVRLVEDSTTPNKVTWLEVRYWDAQSGTLGTPQYYLPGSTTAGSPVLPISYINDRTLLTQILAALQGTLTVAGTVALDTPTLAALESITVQNGAGAAAVNIQDGGNSITVDGSVSVSNFPSSVEISNDSGNPIPVSGTVTITDGSGPVTVDGTVTANQGTSPWAVSLPTGTNTSFYNRMLGAPLVVPAGARSVSVQNIGSDNIDIVTDSSPATVIDPGISLTFDAQEGKTLGAYTFTNSTGSSLYIVTQVR